jgi:hypothetical protein
MTIVLDTPEQINAWVLLSRISQCHLHMKGYKVPGLLKWLKANVPDCKGKASVAAAYPGLLDYCDQFGISAPGGEQCNYQVLVTGRKDSGLHGLYFDRGVYTSMDAIAEAWGEQYAEGRIVILRTMDPERGPNPKAEPMVMG